MIYNYRILLNNFYDRYEGTLGTLVIHNEVSSIYAVTTSHVLDSEHARGYSCYHVSCSYGSYCLVNDDGILDMLVAAVADGAKVIFFSDIFMDVTVDDVVVICMYRYETSLEA